MTIFINKMKIRIYSIAKILGIFVLCRMLTRNRIRILCYHGGCIGDESKYNPLLFLSAKVFRDRIHWLSEKGFTVIPLNQAVQALNERKRIGRLPTVITFDDGWHSTAKQLIPILAEKKMPSTLYLSTSDFEDGWPIPKVTLGYMVWKAGQRRIKIAGLGEGIDGNYRLDEQPERTAFILKGCNWVTEPPVTREKVVERILLLATSLGLNADDMALETGRFDYLSEKELRFLPELGCSVELHGHKHLYPAGNADAIAADLKSCREAIIKRGLAEPSHYCYPSGKYDEAADVMLRKLGVRSATTCIPGHITQGKSENKRYFMPRFLDGENINMLIFEAELSGFSDLLRRISGRRLRI